MSDPMRPVIQSTCELVEALDELRRSLTDPDVGFADGLRVMGRLDAAATAATAACATAIIGGSSNPIAANDLNQPPITA